MYFNVYFFVFLPRKSGNFREFFQLIWKLSRQSRNFLGKPDIFQTLGIFRKNQKIFQTIQKSWIHKLKKGNFTDNPEILQTIQKFSRQSVNFYFNLETFLLTRNFPSNLENFISICKLSFQYENPCKHTITFRQLKDKLKPNKLDLDMVLV